MCARARTRARVDDANGVLPFSYPLLHPASLSASRRCRPDATWRWSPRPSPGTTSPVRTDALGGSVAVCAIQKLSLTRHRASCINGRDTLSTCLQSSIVRSSGRACRSACYRGGTRAQERLPSRSRYGHVTYAKVSRRQQGHSSADVRRTAPKGARNGCPLRPLTAAKPDPAGSVAPPRRPPKLCKVAS